MATDNQKNPVNAGKKLSYAELDNICSQLYQQNQRLQQMLNEMNMTNMFRRLDYLFKVVQFADTIKDSEFINQCIAEIKDSMTVQEEQEDKEDQEKNPQ